MAGGELSDVYVRFEGLEGECMDSQHPGSGGWVAIKSFTFGFGPGEVKSESEQQTTGNARNRAGTPAGGAAGTASGGTTAPGQTGANRTGAGTGAATPRTGNPDFPDVSINKSPDIASMHLLSTNLSSGAAIPTVEVVACRYGGNQYGEERTEYKIPFMRLKFTNVRVTNISMALSDDALPTERMTFRYETVQLETVWTDNETGKRVPGGTQRVCWDVQEGRFATPTESE